ncbi:MAG: hypothetical protein ABI743_14475 [bacterium]
MSVQLDASSIPERLPISGTAQQQVRVSRVFCWITALCGALCLPFAVGLPSAFGTLQLGWTIGVGVSALLWLLAYRFKRGGERVIDEQGVLWVELAPSPAAIGQRALCRVGQAGGIAPTAIQVTTRAYVMVMIGNSPVPVTKYSAAVPGALVTDDGESRWFGFVEWPDEAPVSQRYVKNRWNRTGVNWELQVKLTWPVSGSRTIAAPFQLCGAGPEVAPPITSRRLSR